MMLSQQSSLASGELTPAVHGRTDLEQYLRGVSLADNCFVSVYGGLLNRAGTHFILESETAGTRLVPFQLSEELGFALEFGDARMRFFARGAPLVVQPTDAAVSATVGASAGQWNNISTGTASISAGAALRQIPDGEGTIIGSLTAGAGLATAFDGDTTAISASCARAISYAGNAGKDWGPAGARVIVGFILYGSSNVGLTNRRQTVQVRLEGSNSNFATDIILLGSWPVADGPGVKVARFAPANAIRTTTAYRYHRVKVVGAASGPVGSGDDVVNVAEVQLFEMSAAASGRLTLNGTPFSRAHAQQAVTTGYPGREHVVTCRVPDGSGCNIQVGGSSGLDNVLAARALEAGWHTVAFTPGASPFYLQFWTSEASANHIESAAMLGSGASVPTPMVIGQPFRVDDLAAVTWTQDANSLSLFHPGHPPVELRSGEDALSWSLLIRRAAPAVDAPSAAVLSLAKLGSGTATTAHRYVVTYIALNGEESLPSAPLDLQGVSPLTTTNYMRITIAQPLPDGIVACQVYKQAGGIYGQMGICVGQFDDTGDTPKADQPAPVARTPFDGPGNYPACGTYWEQRLAVAGSVNAPETVETSKPGLTNNFGRSSPAKADDAITFTPAGPQVRQIKHLLAGSSLAIFSAGSVLIARRGESALTPALEGGVQRALACGIADVRPLAIDRGMAFVSAGGGSVRLLDAEYKESDVSLLAEHLFRGRKVVDWGYCELPWSLLWLAMSDGQLVTLALLQGQGIAGWSRGQTAGEVHWLCPVREEGEDRLYMRCRRWLRGAWRYTVERMATRVVPTIKDAYFLDCGGTYDAPATITDIGLASPGTLRASLDLGTGDLFDLDGTGLAALDGKRFKVTSASDGLMTVGNRYSGEEVDWSGLPPWRGSGVARKCVSVLSGLDHLEGEAVRVLNDGSTEGPYVVTDGSIALARPGSRVHYGLPFRSRVTTLDIAEGAEGFGRYKRVMAVQALVRETRGLRMGPDFEHLEGMKQRTIEPWLDPTAAYTGWLQQPVQARWGLGGRICIEQSEPLPMELACLLPTFERGG
jgi:hypothetical protein